MGALMVDIVNLDKVLGGNGKKDENVHQQVNISGNGTVIAGYGAPGSTVTVIKQDDGTEVGEAKVRSDGGFTVKLGVAHTNGEKLSVLITSSDVRAVQEFSIEAPDSTSPAAVKDVLVATDGSSVSGHGAVASEPVRVMSGKQVLGYATADGDGDFKIDLSDPQVNSEALSVYAFDAAGNRSEPVVVNAPDVTAPSLAHARISGDGRFVDGEAEPMACIIVERMNHSANGNEDAVCLGHGRADAQGRFFIELIAPLTNGEALSVVAKDEAENRGLIELVAPDLQQPQFVGQVEFDGENNVVRGISDLEETRVTVTDAAGEVVAVHALAQGGVFSVELSRELKEGEILEVTLTDAAGNSSVQTVTATYPNAEIRIDEVQEIIIPTGNIDDVDAAGRVSGTEAEAAPQEISAKAKKAIAKAAFKALVAEKEGESADAGNAKKASTDGAVQEVGADVVPKSTETEKAPIVLLAEKTEKPAERDPLASREARSISIEAQDAEPFDDSAVECSGEGCVIECDEQITDGSGRTVRWASDNQDEGVVEDYIAECDEGGCGEQVTEGSAREERSVSVDSWVAEGSRNAQAAEDSSVACNRQDSSVECKEQVTEGSVRTVRSASVEAQDAEPFDGSVIESDKKVADDVVPVSMASSIRTLRSVSAEGQDAETAEDSSIECDETEDSPIDCTEQAVADAVSMTMEGSVREARSVSMEDQDVKNMKVSPVECIEQAMSPLESGVSADNVHHTFYKYVEADNLNPVVEQLQMFYI